MSIIQFLRIFWARRLLILAATVSCLIGGYIVTLVMPPAWEAHSRVMMGLLKPDPVTGMLIGNNAGAYVATQAEIIKDESVAGKAADELGVSSDPAVIAAYNALPRRGRPEFHRYVADLIIKNTKTTNVAGSNILDISYTATTPAFAMQVANTLRSAYLQASLDFRREDAARNAAWYQQQADKVKLALDAAEMAKSDYERQNGIVMADEKTDVDSARLRSLAASQGAPAIFAPAPAAPSPAATQLAMIDTEIGQASKVLGPNHPELQALRATRAALVQQVARDEAASRAAAGAAAGAASAGAGAVKRELQSAEQAVINKGDKLGRLAQLQTNVELLMDEYTKTAGRAAEFREESAVADTGLTPLAKAVEPQTRKFPNKPLIFAGSLGLGLATGILVALLVELFDRRVRGVEDLLALSEAPLLAVIAPPGRAAPGRAALGRSRLGVRPPWARRPAPA